VTIHKSHYDNFAKNSDTIYNTINVLYTVYIPMAASSMAERLTRVREVRVQINLDRSNLTQHCKGIYLYTWTKKRGHFVSPKTLLRFRGRVRVRV